MRVSSSAASLFYKNGITAVDLGNEAPIEADGERHTPDDHRRISLRWLAGTILTGISGGALIGAAAYAALDRRSNFAEAPQSALVQRKEERGDATVNQRKGDRLVKSVDIVAAKQTFRAPTTVKTGDKEVIRNRSFTRVATALSLVDTGLGDDVPPFNPLKLLAAARNAGEAPAEAVAAQDDAEVSFTVRDLASAKLSTQPADLTIDEVQAQVGEFVKSLLAAGSKAPLPLPPQMLLMRTSRASLGPSLSYANVGEKTQQTPFSSIEVKMVPENVTLIAKASTIEKQPTQMEERLVVARRNETLEDILRNNGIPKAQIAAISSAVVRRGDAAIAEGRRVKLLFADLDGSGKALTLARISIHSDDRIEAMIAVTDDGRYVQVAKTDAAPAKAAKAKKSDDDDESDESDSGGIRLYDSLYETALKQEIPRPIVDDLVRIFANDVDFQRSVIGGDNFEAFYDENEESEGKGELLYASITTRNETYKYYRYLTTDDNAVDYYDENGRSTRKFLVRKPISIGETRSGFGMRRHPVLGYYKVHTGIDWAAPIGTPIFAAGNGTIIKAQWDSGYGRRVEIQHANGYITTYNHMSGFAKGITEGIRVRQGQAVGFLGSSGLSTGPHLHYEVMVNGHFVDPLRVKLARTREFDGRMLADFKRERDRIDQLMAKAPNATRVAARTGN